jgi:hypothetical protein
MYGGGGCALPVRSVVRAADRDPLKPASRTTVEGPWIYSSGKWVGTSSVVSRSSWTAARTPRCRTVNHGGNSPGAVSDIHPGDPSLQEDLQWGCARAADSGGRSRTVADVARSRSPTGADDRPRPGAGGRPEPIGRRRRGRRASCARRTRASRRHRGARLSRTPTPRVMRRLVVPLVIEARPPNRSPKRRSASAATSAATMRRRWGTRCRAGPQRGCRQARSFTPTPPVRPTGLPKRRACDRQALESASTASCPRHREQSAIRPALPSIAQASVVIRVSNASDSDSHPTPTVPAGRVFHVKHRTHCASNASDRARPRAAAHERSEPDAAAAVNAVTSRRGETRVRRGVSRETVNDHGEPFESRRSVLSGDGASRSTAQNGATPSRAG